MSTYLRKPSKSYVLHLYRQLLRGSSLLEDETLRGRAQTEIKLKFRAHRGEKNFVRTRQLVKDAENRMKLLIAKLQKDRQEKTPEVASSSPVNRQDVLYLYRDLLTYIRALDDEEKRDYYREQCRSLFREHKDEQQPNRIYELYTGGVNKLCVLKVRVPSSKIPNFVRYRKQSFLGRSGEMYPMGSDGVPIQQVSVNEQAHKHYRHDLGYEHVDPDDLKRHHAIIERMQFRGPVWDKYAREGPPPEWKPTDPEELAQFPEGFFDAGVYDYKQSWYKGKYKSPFADLINRRD